MTTPIAANKIFGTDGVRGKANCSPMTVETALALGRAVGKLFRKNGKKRRVVIGKDTRLSCYMFENALIAGLCSMGTDTLMVGPLPTPAVAFITRAYRADAGVVISASHNPYYDNGIKFFSSDGFKLPDNWEEAVEGLIATHNFDDALPHDNEIGRNKKIDDAQGRYIEFVKATYSKGQTLSQMKIALDCANGAGYRVAPLIFQELDGAVTVVGDEPNGLNINLNCGSLYPETVIKLVKETGADIGIALDGDADRVLMVDEKGNLIDGDVILAICARDMQQQGVLRNNKVVGTVMSNFGFIRAMQKIGIEVVQSKVGDRYVIQSMLDHQCNLGGEPSGHLIFLDQNTTGDGLVSALQVMRIMHETGRRLSELAAFVEKTPQVIVNVKVKEKRPIDSLTKACKVIREAEGTLASEGRVLVRYSGTESICRVMVEGPDEKAVLSMANAIGKAIEEEIG